MIPFHNMVGNLNKCVIIITKIHAFILESSYHRHISIDINSIPRWQYKDSYHSMTFSHIFLLLWVSQLRVEHVRIKMMWGFIDRSTKKAHEHIFFISSRESTLLILANRKKSNSQSPVMHSSLTIFLLLS